MIRILYMVDDLKYGGAQRQIVELIKNVDKSCIDPTLLVYHPARIHVEELVVRNIPVEYIPKIFKYSPWYLARLTRYIKRAKPDIIHSFTQTANFWARVGGLIGGCGIVITSIRGSNFRHAYLERYMSKISAKIITNTNTTKRNLIEVGVAPGKIIVIPNGIDTVRFTPKSEAEKKRLKTEHGIPIDQKVFSLIGQFRPVKNHDCLITALTIMRKKGDRLPVVVFVGKDFDKSLYQKLRTHVKRAKLSFNVRFIPPTPAIEKIYALSDCIVLPSLWEGCSNALLESMSSGIPVICSDIPENTCIVAHEKQGLLFKSNDASALAGSIRKMMAFSDETIEKMGKAGRKLVQERYSIKKMVSSTEKIYQEELSR